MTSPAYHYRVEHVDTDASGVVHFSRYASLMESAALEELERRGAGLDALLAAGIDMRVRELRIQYHAPAQFRNELRLEARVEQVGVARVRMAVQVFQQPPSEAERSLLTSGTLELVTVDRAAGTPVTLPDTLKNTLSRSTP
ncbi:thioesterase family protein [Vitiosangium sp. GDMCC 1.1324]|uniref:acyl-CoA thioesterase n=1 Tax=Vitiosangium sp. (strain GDMCC 1.1324) TaxID=2138576 RepID=UPI000D370320|nr:hotdog domain-containing protein [Vitiosangium sp. GDMCC 1.1324]PTL80870.1 4-hydroxybenzoyl-CoA thioesterase [Vitiosangium sp. GDMCC 1.1324]